MKTRWIEGIYVTRRRNGNRAWSANRFRPRRESSSTLWRTRYIDALVQGAICNSTEFEHIEHIPDHRWMLFNELSAGGLRRQAAIGQEGHARGTRSRNGTTFGGSEHHGELDQSDIHCYRGGWLVCDAQKDLWESRSISQLANFHLWLHAPSNLVQGPSSLPNAYLSALLGRTLSQRLHGRRDNGGYEVLTEGSRSVVVWQVEWEEIPADQPQPYLVPSSWYRRGDLMGISAFLTELVGVVTVHWQKNLDGESEQVFWRQRWYNNSNRGFESERALWAPSGNHCDARHWRNIRTLEESTPPLHDSSPYHLLIFNKAFLYCLPFDCSFYRDNMIFRVLPVVIVYDSGESNAGGSRRTVQIGE